MGQAHPSGQGHSPYFQAFHSCLHSNSCSYSVEPSTRFLNPGHLSSIYTPARNSSVCSQFGSTHSLRDLDECASPSLKEGLEEFDARPSGRPPRKSMSSPMLCALVSQPGARAGASRPTTPSLAAAPAPAMAPAKLPPDCAAVAQAEVPLDVDALAGHRRQGGDLNDLVWYVWGERGLPAWRENQRQCTTMTRQACPGLRNT